MTNNDRIAAVDASAVAHPRLALTGLTQDPTIKIKPTRTSALSQLREAWTHRELLYFLIWRDLKVRYSAWKTTSSALTCQPRNSPIPPSQVT